MKNPAQIVQWLDEQIKNYEKALSNKSIDVDLKNQMQSAMDMAVQTKTFIEDDRWVTK